ncbi:MAG: cupin domain-containing protein [Gemmatimonadales bacterium]
MRTTLATLCVLLFLGGCQRQGDRETGAALPAGDAAAGAVNWQPGPPALPPGARFALLEGDPAKAGAFRFRLEMPDSYEVRPHYHPMSERIEVLEGTLLMGRGREWDDSKLEPLAAGEQANVAAEEPHYARTRGLTVIEVRTTGPFGTTWVNPADDLQKTTTR